jgi:hypothetical protein
MSKWSRLVRKILRPAFKWYPRTGPKKRPRDDHLKPGRSGFRMFSVDVFLLPIQMFLFFNHHPPDGNLLQPDLVSPPLKRQRLAAECPVVGSGDVPNGMIPDNRMCASQPPPSTLKKTTSSNADDEHRQDVFGGFTQPAQVIYCILSVPVGSE